MPEASPWTLDSVLAKVEETIEDLHFNLPDSTLDLHSMTDEQLREKLAKFGAYDGYLLARLAYIESSKVAVERILESSINRKMVELERSGDKRRLKDVMAAEAIASSPQLRDYNRLSIELTAQHAALTKLHESLDLYWKTISRLLSSRSSEIGKL